MPVRTVRHGRIKLGNQWWVPDERYRAYDGRLDGQRFFFMQCPAEAAQLVVLWGTEADANGDMDAPKPEEVDGCLPWYVWHLEAGE